MKRLGCFREWSRESWGDQRIEFGILDATEWICSDDDAVASQRGAEWKMRAGTGKGNAGPGR